MRLGIRAKLVTLLIVVALLPLVAAVLTITIGGRRLGGEFIGQSIQAMAASEALVQQMSLVKDIEKLHLLLNQTTVRSALAAADKAVSPEAIARLDAAWPTMSLSDQPLAGILGNPIAQELLRIQKEDPRFVELLVTDGHGRLAAATARTADFHKADDDWWKAVENNGQARVFIPPVSYDPSAGIWSVGLCIPIASEGRFYGVGRAALDVSQWIKAHRAAIGQVNAHVMLVDQDGRAIHTDNAKPLSAASEEWHGPIATLDSPGHRVTRGGQIQAYAPIVLPNRIGQYDVVAARWLLVLSVPESEALESVARLSMVVLASGLGIAAVIFLVGLFLVDRVVVRRVHRLQGATRKVADGDLTHRVAPGPQYVRDEIDDLADDFNEMVGRIRNGHDKLLAADRLKMKFIRIAGHELRTPVSYILGTVRLLKDSQDPTRLLHAIQKMGAKAKRLDEIIRSMFKLMPDQVRAEEMQYRRVRTADLLEEIHLDCFPFADKMGQRIIMEGADRVESFRADGEKLRDVLENLVMNAIRFTPNGGVIKIRVSRQLGDHVSFAVQDQGPGIGENDLPHIFEPFYSGGDEMQHSSGAEGDAKGVGLGLAIVRNFVEMHGGEVNVSSGPHGSVFTVTVPIEPPAQQAEGTAGPQ